MCVCVCVCKLRGHNVDYLMLSVMVRKVTTWL